MHPIIYGYRTRNKPLGQMQYVCPKCSQNANHTVVKTQYMMTLFFVPLFPVSSKYTATCNNCRFQEKVEKQQAKQMFPSGA